jgi:hypothetical protein
MYNCSIDVANAVHAAAIRDTYISISKPVLDTAFRALQKTVCLPAAPRKTSIITIDSKETTDA